MQQINIYLTECGWLLTASRIMICLLLVLMAYKDIREHKVSVVMLVLCGTISVITSSIVMITEPNGIWKSHLAGMMIGLIFIGISKVTREGLGYGDSLLLCVLGLYLGIWSLLGLLITTWMLTAVAAGIMLVRSRFKKQTLLPMIPFVAVGYITVWLAEIMTITNA